MCKVREEIRQLKSDIIAKAALCNRVVNASGIIEDSVSPSRWTETVPGVNSVLCALDAVTDNRTVVNCVFNPGASMEQHEHDRIEAVHVISGSIFETVSGTLLVEGDSKRLEAYERHGWWSESGCMLTITWKPAYLKT